MFRLRPATEDDSHAIRALIRAVQINPISLDWHRFVVAILPDGRMIGCGQIKPHGGGSRELASIAVVPEWRRQGVASAIIEHLIITTGNTGELYLTCRAKLGPFYERFGFRSIGAEESPPYFRRILRVVRIMGKLHFMGETLLVMKRDL